MPDETPSRHTVSTNEQFAKDLMETYPAANNVPQAILMAAQDGQDFKQAVQNDLECYIRAVTRDEIDEEESIEDLRND